MTVVIVIVTTKKIRSNYTIKINSEAAAKEAQLLSNTSFHRAIKHNPTNMFESK